MTDKQHPLAGNQFASKDKGAFIHMRVTKAEKGAIKQAAQASGKKITDFILPILRENKVVADFLKKYEK